MGTQDEQGWYDSQMKARFESKSFVFVEGKKKWKKDYAQAGAEER